MKAKIRIEYSEILGHWSWEVAVNTSSAYGFEDDYDNAFCAAEFALKDLAHELRIEVR